MPRLRRTAVQGAARPGGGFMTAFIVGLFIGAVVGMFVMALAAMAAQADRDDE